MELICKTCHRLILGLGCENCLKVQHERNQLKAMALGAIACDVYRFPESFREDPGERKHISRPVGETVKPVPTKNWEALCGYKRKGSQLPNLSARVKITSPEGFCTECLTAMNFKGENTK